MAITLNLSAGDQTRLVNAVSWKDNYQPIINGVTNPETKGQFTLRRFREIVSDYVREYEDQLAADASTVTFNTTYVPPIIT